MRQLLSAVYDTHLLSYRITCRHREDRYTRLQRMPLICRRLRIA